MRRIEAPQRLEPPATLGQPYERRNRPPVRSVGHGQVNYRRVGPNMHKSLQALPACHEARGLSSVRGWSRVSRQGGDLGLVVDGRLAFSACREGMPTYLPDRWTPVSPRMRFRCEEMAWPTPTWVVGACSRRGLTGG